MGTLITEEMLETFAVISPLDEVAARVTERFGDVVDRFRAARWSYKGEAIPRKSTSERLRRIASASSSSPIWSPSLFRETVVTLSTMIRLASFNPFRSVAWIKIRNKGASVVSVVNRQIVMESVSNRSS
jgi:hypothetical protein